MVLEEPVPEVGAESAPCSGRHALRTQHRDQQQAEVPAVARDPSFWLPRLAEGPAILGDDQAEEVLGGPDVHAGPILVRQGHLVELGEVFVDDQAVQDASESWHLMRQIAEQARVPPRRGHRPRPGVVGERGRGVEDLHDLSSR